MQKYESLWTNTDLNLPAQTQTDKTGQTRPTWSQTGSNIVKCVKQGNGIKYSQTFQDKDPNWGLAQLSNNSILNTNLAHNPIIVLIKTLQKEI